MKRSAMLLLLAAACARDPIAHSPDDLAERLDQIGVNHYTWGHDAEAEHYFRNAYKSAERARRPEQQARALAHLGQLAATRGDEAQARALYAAALEKSGESPSARIVALLNLAQLHASRGEWGTARARLEEARDEKTGPVLTAAVLNDLGFALYRLGDAEAAERRFLGALELAGRDGPASLRAAALMNLGRLLARTERESDALERYAEALALQEASDDVTAAAETCALVGWVHEGAGRHAEALAGYARARGFNAAAGLADREARDLKNLARVYRLMGQEELAEDCLREARRLR